MAAATRKMSSSVGVGGSGGAWRKCVQAEVDRHGAGCLHRAGTLGGGPAVWAKNTASVQVRRVRVCVCVCWWKSSPSPYVCPVQSSTASSWKLKNRLFWCLGANWGLYVLENHQIMMWFIIIFSFSQTRNHTKLKFRKENINELNKGTLWRPDRRSAWRHLTPDASRCYWGLFQDVHICFPNSGKRDEFPRIGLKSALQAQYNWQTIKSSLKKTWHGSQSCFPLHVCWGWAAKAAAAWQQPHWGDWTRDTVWLFDLLEEWKISS